MPNRARAEQARATMDALAATPDVFESFFDQARIGLALADLSSRYVRANTTYADLLGRAPEDLVGVAFIDLLHPEDQREGRLRLADLLEGRSSYLQADQRYLGPDGRELWVLHGVATVPDADGRPAWFAVSAQDIGERRRAEQDLRALTASLAERAVRDPLTGLANRTLLEERLRAVLARDARTSDTTGVLFLDLDSFKAVNDRYGHAVGDAVLRTVARRLQDAVRPSDTVARLGGDEFVVLAEGAVEVGLSALVGRLERAINEPVRIGSLTLNVGVSIGLAVASRGLADAASLLAEADRRMYDAKRRGVP